MAFWNNDRDMDDLLRRSDKTLNALVVVLLAAFALGTGAYYYGQMNPRSPSTSQAAPNAASSPTSTPVPAQP